jgi:hypothetical protein
MSDQGKTKIVILHNPNPMHTQQENTKAYLKIIGQLSDFCKVFNYYFKFGSNETNFKLGDLTFDSVAIDIYEHCKTLKRFIILCFEEAAPYGLFFANVHPEMCYATVCFPLRLNTKESLDRYLWKYVDKDGWRKYVSQKYDIVNYLLKINDQRLFEIQQFKHRDEEKFILYSIMNFNLRKQYAEIPKQFNTITHLFTRLNSSTGLIARDFDRKAIADMKEITGQSDALLTGMMWYYARVQYDEDLLTINDQKLLRIHYIMGEFAEQSEMELVDTIKLLVLKLADR